MALIAYSEPYHPRWVPFNGKIADITHADTALHLLTLANGAGTGAIAGETRKIIAAQIQVVRAAGTGYFLTYPNEGARAITYTTGGSYMFTIIANGTQRLQYALSVANDDWDVHCSGYVVEA